MTAWTRMAGREAEVAELRADRALAIEYLKAALESLDDPNDRAGGLLALRTVAEAPIAAGSRWCARDLHRWSGLWGSESKIHHLRCPWRVLRMDIGIRPPKTCTSPEFWMD